ncbi:hypothetical protein KP78_36600 [Jeotgalibacillus soli]|uniref:Uncharacterized protein n=1 Tax=Jeotgalibacillus soli TaxID=889306 RepID=A0A0C2VH47_9BACL|nr:hypothetical protein KP78_36600 [Jeotgalibacillus soli]
MLKTRLTGIFEKIIVEKSSLSNASSIRGTKMINIFSKHALFLFVFQD